MGCVKRIGSEDSEAQNVIYLLPGLFQSQRDRGTCISDAEAKALYEMWALSEPGSDQLKPSARKHLNALKVKGYLSGFGECLSMTDKGREVIVEMVTRHPSSFNKDGAPPSYSKIKAMATKRPRQSLLMKSARKDIPKVDLKYCNECGKTTKHRRVGDTYECEKCNRIKYPRPAFNLRQKSMMSMRLRMGGRQRTWQK